jgi:hypothetical protein
VAQSSCAECGLALGESDQFCGHCGTPAPNGRTAGAPQPAAWPATPPAPPPSPGRASGWGQASPPSGTITVRQDRLELIPPAGAHTALSARFFGHASRRPAGRPSNPTRYLCAAAYLDPGYANDVIGELVATHRAVAPSVDIDLGPIVRHCLQARRIALIRDAVLTAVLVLGLVLATAPTIGMLRGPSWQRRSAGAKIGIAAGAVAALLVVAGLIGLIVLVNGLRSLATTGSAAGSVGAAGAVGATFLIEFVLILIVVGTTVAVYTSVKYRTLSEQLRPDAGPFRFGRANPDVEARIAQVEAAQWGNVTLYSGENPFIGTGRINRAWSVAIELDRARPAGQEMSAQPPRRRYVPVDPVELQQFIRDRLLKLNDPALPANERVSALTVEDHVVGEGLRSWDGPLIDPAQKVPYSLARPEAIDALIRHPQAGMRYYQRLSVSDRGQAVHSGGQEVIAGVDQEIAISAFVYVAVEGRMLYLQFVTTVLPPIHREYHIIDRLPKTSSGTFMTKVFLETATTMFGNLAGAPFMLYRTLRQIRREQRAFAAEVSSSDDYLFGDVGVRQSVRQIGAAARPHTHIQVLDVIKYTHIIERMLTDTVFDFLRAKGVDTSAYVRAVGNIVNNSSVINYGTVNGPVSASSGGTVNQTVQPAPEQPQGES